MPFGVSLGLARGNELVAGVVFEAFDNRMYSASLGNGAFCNEDRLSVNSGMSLRNSLIATGFGYLGETRRQQALKLADIVSEIRDIRRFGAASLDLCAVAHGKADAYFERGLNSWDVAAGLLIAAEAGATIRQPFIPDWSQETELVVSAPDIYQDLIKLID
jgi:myo-inositol-1(or 4)-monophosphatase